LALVLAVLKMLSYDRGCGERYEVCHRSMAYDEPT
jgi:hypothetical protein